MTALELDAEANLHGAAHAAVVVRLVAARRQGAIINSASALGLRHGPVRRPTRPLWQRGSN